MHLTVYMSDYTGRPEDLEGELSSIITAAKRNNPALGITGVLFYHSGHFIQVIEGEKKNISRLLEVIVKDPRHRAINYLIDEDVNERGFSAWNMDSFNLSRKEGLNLDELQRISEAYKANLTPRSDTLVEIYKMLLASGVFRE